MQKPVKVIKKAELDEVELRRNEQVGEPPIE